MTQGIDADAARLSRRDLLGMLGAGTVGVAMGSASPLLAEVDPHANRPLGPLLDRSAPPRRVASMSSPFALGDVDLLESRFTEARVRGAGYILDLDPDRMLHNFRRNAGLEPKAPVYGGWESQEPWVDIRLHGHTLGHWLTAASLMYASTADALFRERIDYVVDELKACQDADGSGLVCAFPDGAEQIENAVRGERFIGVPWYTVHKIMAGLRDAHLLAGNPTALEVLIGLTDWSWTITEPMSDEDFQVMLRREHGGMNEVLADIHSFTDEPRYLTLAERFCDQALLIPLSQGTDSLDGLHSNTQTPKVVGFQRLYELTGRPEYRAASRFFWETVVERRSFVTGGHGDVEHFFPPEEFPERLGSAKTMETCCSYNMLRLTRLLFADEPSARYADFYERALYNTILASQDPDSGACTYFQAIRPGYVKFYHTPIDSFWCCTGTGMENHAKYNDSIYYRSDDELWVNLFLPSSVRWKEKGLVLRQDTRFPEEAETRLTVAAQAPMRAVVHVRHPAWCADMEVTVNGSALADVGEPGSYVSIDREWTSGDEVHVRLPMAIGTESLPGAPARIAFTYGPLVLAGRLGQEGLYPGADILRNERTSGETLNIPMEIPTLVGDPASLAERLRPVPGAPLTFETAGAARPVDVELIPYHEIAHERYNLYWEVVAP